MKRLNNKKVKIKDKEQFYAIQEIALELGFSCHTPGEVRKKEAPRYMFFNFQSYGYGYEKEQFDSSFFTEVTPEYILNLVKPKEAPALNVGTILIATEDCGKEALTVGKEYAIMSLFYNGFSIKNDEDDRRIFAFEDYREFFKVKEEEEQPKVGTMLTAKQSLKLYNIELPNLAGYEKYLVMKEDKQNAEVTATRLWSETQFSIDDVSISLEIRFDKKDFKLSHGLLDSVTFDKDTVEQARDRVKCITAALDYAEKELKHETQNYIPQNKKQTS